MKSYRDLIVWQKSMSWVTLVYSLTSKIPESEKFGLISQIRRSSVSIPSNIAEGAGRNTKKDFDNFLGISLGSSFELDTQLVISNRLGYVSSDDFEKIEKTINFAQKYHLVILIKGAYTLIIDEKNVYINPTGNQALATGGSGDVLAGMITSLRAQGYQSVDAALLGVYLHGLAADLALKNQSEESLLITDVINYLGKAFKTLLK